MRRISFNSRFVNGAGNDLIPGKIHTIRQNYNFWKRFEGRDVALFSWEGKPYRSSQKVFCVKRLVSVQWTYLEDGDFWIKEADHAGLIPINFLARKDGFSSCEDFQKWFAPYGDCMDMAILHFTDFRY
jgi:hypothetical protein